MPAAASALEVAAVELTTQVLAEQAATAADTVPLEGEAADLLETVAQAETEAADTLKLLFISHESCSHTRRKNH